MEGVGQECIRRELVKNAETSVLRSSPPLLWFAKAYTNFKRTATQVRRFLVTLGGGGGGGGRGGMVAQYIPERARRRARCLSDTFPMRFRSLSDALPMSFRCVSDAFPTPFRSVFRCVSDVFPMRF